MGCLGPKGGLRRQVVQGWAGQRRGVAGPCAGSCWMLDAGTTQRGAGKLRPPVLC